MNNLLYGTRVFILGMILMGRGGLAGTPETSDVEKANKAYADFADYFGLTKSDRAASADPDHDNVSNFDEFILGTDPLCADTDHDGFDDDKDAMPLSRAYVPWGDSLFTRTNDVSYMWPPWMVAAYKEGGNWSSTPTGHAWRVFYDATGHASLQMEVDRGMLTNNLVLSLTFTSDDAGSLFLDLYDRDEQMVVGSVGGNLLAGMGTNTVRRVLVPLVSNPRVVGLSLRYGSGSLSVLDSTLYVDENGDGFDADQARQMGIPDSPTEPGANFPVNGMVETNGVTENPGNGVGQGGSHQSGTGHSNTNQAGRVSFPRGVIVVDQVAGNDVYSGLSANDPNGNGPKKTIKGGRQAVREGETLLIRSGVYGESLDIRGRKVDVVIKGDVRL